MICIVWFSTTCDLRLHAVRIPSIADDITTDLELGGKVILEVHAPLASSLIMNLDLVISVDTSTAYLAGALGTPLWILNRFDACWRWLLDRTDSPCYPTARIYRQERRWNWDGVVQRVSKDLIKLVT